MTKTYAKGFSPGVSFDRSAAVPVFEQLVDELRTAIGTGAIPSGTRLASTRVMAQDWGVSRNTVTQVFNALLDEGFLTSRVGDGTYVSTALEPLIPDSVADAPDAEEARNFPFRKLSRRGRALISKLDYSTPEEPRPFLPNIPDLREFPMRSWLRLMNEVSGALKGKALAGVSNAGYYPLRRGIAHHLSVTRNIPVQPDQVIITTGSQQGLDLAIRLLADRGDPVWVENPGYPGTRAVLQANGANLQYIPVDDAGMQVERGIEQALSPRVICVTPMRQFPTGAVLSEDRKQQLLNFGNNVGAWIIEDDFDAEAHYVAQSPRSLLAFKNSTRVVLLGTFSTTLVPSLRLGYLVVPPDLIPAFANARSIAQGHGSLVEQMVLSEMMNRGLYAAHLRKMRKLYLGRQKTLVSAMEDAFNFTVPDLQKGSGMHITLKLGQHVNDTALASRLGKSNLFARALSPTYVETGGQQGLMLGFAAYRDAELIPATHRLAEMTSAVPDAVFAS